MAENLKTHFYDIFSAQRSHDKGFPGGSVVKNSTANEGTTGDSSSIPGLGRYPGRGNGNPLQYSCQKKFHGQRSLVGYSPKGHKELDMTVTKQLSTSA